MASIGKTSGHDDCGGHVVRLGDDIVGDVGDDGGPQLGGLPPHLRGARLLGLQRRGGGQGGQHLRTGQQLHRRAVTGAEYDWILFLLHVLHLLIQFMFPRC